MKQYIGTKVINAKPMNRLKYNEYRGWKLPEDENGSDEGYLIEYVDGGAANTKEHNGYVSWSPCDVFDKSYKASGEMSFSGAIEFIKMGHKVARNGWNGKGMWLILTKMYTHTLIEQGGENTNYVPFITMKIADGMFVPWLASQTDMLAEDWEIVL